MTAPSIGNGLPPGLPAQAEQLYRRRALAQSLALVEKVLAEDPLHAPMLYLRALILRDTGDVPGAQRGLKELVRRAPRFAPAYEALGHLYHAQGRVPEAIQALRMATAIDSSLAGSWKLLARLLDSESSEEESQQALQGYLKASHTHPAVAKIAELLQTNRLDVAEALCREYLQRHPTDVSAIRLLADLGTRVGQHRDAQRLLERCLELAPDFHLARYDYARVLNRLRDSAEALRHVEVLLRTDADNLAYHVLHAAILVRLGRFDEAVASYGRVLQRDPDHAPIWLSYGHALKTNGAQVDAINAYLEAIRLRPDLGEAYWSLANLKTYRFEPVQVDGMRAALADPNCRPREVVHFCFALGKALEDLGEHADAFAVYERGNAIKKSQVRYDADDNERAADRAIATCVPELFLRQAGAGAPDDSPIFLVGLPRAGSTLLEQILASHSRVEGTAELPDVIALARQLDEEARGLGGAGYPEVLSDLDRDRFRALGEEYLRRTLPQRRGAPRFIDKMPNNFAHVGLISLMLPNAKIIDARRHPMAACFSGFKQLFAAGQHFTYGLEDIARYYATYVRLVDHWAEVLPGKVLTIRYEDVVADTEAQVRRMLAYCGLEFEPQCLEFHKTERAVRTASSEQVRQPVYRSALEQWRHYEPFLAPARAVLGPLVDRYERELTGSPPG